MLLTRPQSPPSRIFAVFAALAVLISADSQAQRQMERLGRGVVALRTGSSSVYVGWRLLATDPADTSFNLYRVTGGATNLLAAGITNSCNFVDSGAVQASAHSWFVQPVFGGLTQASIASFSMPPNAPIRQYLPVPLQPVTGGAYPPYDVKFCWVGDFDGDGEYDFLVDRLSTTGDVNQYLQAYLRDGTFLWQMDMGYNSTNQYNIEPGASAISTGDKDNVTVYDLDGDGRAEVIVRVARGIVLPNGTVVTGPDDTTEYLYVLDGMTGEERAHATIPNPFFSDGPLGFHFGIMYCDGIHPSVVLEGENRVGSGPFNEIAMAFDFKDGALVQRWEWTPPAGGNYSRGHQIRIADVNHDGIDDLVEIGSVNSGFDGQPLFDTEIVHGDRTHITDMDPDRPGLETFVIQQDNPTLLATALYDSATGKFIKKWYSSGVVDVGRGIAIDIDPNHKGCELYSTQPGIFDCKGSQIFANNIWPPEGLWWDADLSREFVDGAGSGAYSPVVNKFNPASGTAGRLYTIYNDNGGVHQSYGGRSAFWGDIFGDWREELILVANDYSEIRIYISTIPATNRLYCLMQNPAYRCQSTVKGYYEANYPDYYLGTDMQPPPPPPNSDAKLVWRGGGANAWDAGVAANWFTNNLWISNTIPVAFNAGDTVLFDLTGSNGSPVNLVGTLTPGAVRVHAPDDYVFGGDGSLTGGMILTKVGAGKLTLTGTNMFTGATTIWEGPLIVNGSLNASAVVVRSGAWLDAALGGSGFAGGGVTVYRGGSLSPGNGANSPGTLTVSNGLVEINGAFNRFHLSDDPTGSLKANDLLNVIGNVTLTGTNTIYVTPLNTNLAAGVYPLINYSGALVGGLSNLVVDGLPGIPAALTNPPGQIALTVKAYRPPATVTWTGGRSGNAWDLLATSNWLNGAVRDRFAPLDSVRFDNLGATNPTVTLADSLNPAAIVVDTASNYTWTGSGGIIGGATLTKSNTGTLTLNTPANTFTGRTWIAGGTLVVSELDPVGFPSPIGNPGANPSNLVMSGSSTLRVTSESYTDRGLTLNAGTNSLEVLNAVDQLTIAGAVVGPGVLQKLGPGALALTSSNSYGGGTLIRAGSVSLGGGNANQYALGTGLVTLDNGTLRMFSDSGSYDHAYWNLYIPTNSTGTIYADDRCYLHGTLTGAGTLNFNVYYVRTELDGNWATFTGQINVGTDSGGGDFRIGNTYGYANASINLASGIYAYHISGTAVSLGALSGSAGAYLSGTPWTVGARNTDATFAGSISGNSITKVGAGTWTLTGSNYYTGTTVVSAGQLQVNGDNSAATGGVTVNSGATLGGVGVIGGSTTVNGQLAPGNGGIGTLTFTNSLTFGSSGVAAIEINKAGATSDLLACGARITYGGTLQVTNLSGPLADGDSFKVFDAATYAGSFADYKMPALATNLGWDYSALATSGTVSVINTNVSSGPANLVWKGDGAANLWDVSTTPNWLDGASGSTFSQWDAVLFNDLGSNNVAVGLNGTLQPSRTTVNATKDYVFSGSGSIGGTNALVKSGTGRLTVNTTNSFSGGIVLSNGVLASGAAFLNTAGLGTGDITFMGGTLQFAGYGSSSTGTDWGGNTNRWVVPTNQTGVVLMPPRFGWGTPFTSRLTGGGMLNIVDDYVRCGFGGDWSAFTGQLNIGPCSSTCEFRINNAFGYANAAFYLSNGVTCYNINGNGLTIDLGELAGTAGATLGTGNGNSTNPTWRVGARNTDATFAGRIIDAGVTTVTKIGSGAWTLSGTNSYSGPTVISNGALVVNGFLGTNSVTVYGRLAGNGSIGGRVTVQPGGMLAPGDGLGILTVSNTLTLLPGSTTLMEIGKSPVTNDLVRITGALTYGGTLSVTNLAPNTLAAGDHFQLFSAGNYVGAFAGTNLPVLNAGLAWNTNRLAVDGSLWVLSTVPPHLGSASVSGTNLTLNASGGTPNWTCYLLASTNVTQPPSQWVPIATNQFDGGGNLALAFPIDPAFLQRFYRLQVP